MIRASIVVLAIAAVFCFAAAADPDAPCAGVNEAKYPCGKSCEKTCNTPLPGYCKGIQCMPPFGCRCKNGFARNTATKQCVPIQDCPSV